jgi:hypothetical protein
LIGTWRIACGGPIERMSCAITSGSFPTEWRISKIIPVLKSFHWSPLRDQIVDNIESHNLLSPFQSGFRTGHNIVTALLNITDDI